MASFLKQHFRRFLKRTGIRRGLLGGVLVLLLVVIIWVGSAALSRFLFTQESYPKPLFMTYFKTSLFSMYLVAFVFWRPWQRLCLRPCVRRRRRESRDVSGCECVGECRCGFSDRRVDEERNPLLSHVNTSPTHIVENNYDSAPGEGSCNMQPMQSDNPCPKYGSVASDQPRPLISSDQPHLLVSSDQPCPLVSSTGYIDCVTSTLPYDQSMLKQSENAASSGYQTNEVSLVDVESSWPQSSEDSSTQNMDKEGYSTWDMDREDCSSHESKKHSPLLLLSEDMGNITSESGSKFIHSNSHTITSMEMSQEVSKGTGLPSRPFNSADICGKREMVPSLPPTQACPFANYVHDGRDSSPKFLTFKPNFHRGSINGSIGSNMITCPLNPKLSICLLGPPETEPLGCYDTDSTDSERDTTEPLSPCHTKCCKVKFKPTVEIRECKGLNTSHTKHKKLYRLLTNSKKYSKEKFAQKKKQELLSVAKVSLLSLVFGLLWFFANYLYAAALETTSVAAVNTLSSMSGVIVMVLVAVPFLSVTDGDKFTLSRILVTLTSVGGVILVSLSSLGQGGNSEFNAGALYALGGAVLYAVYLVLLRRMVTDHASLEIPMFFGFVGLFNAVLILPIVVIWHVTGLETFELPPTSDVWTLLLVNGFVGTVLSELLWLWGVFLTSPLLGTLALSLVTPFSIAYSIVVEKADFSWMFITGAVLIILAFIGVTILEHYGAWDPIWAGLKNLFSKARDYRSHGEFRNLSPESQKLITSVSPPHNYCQEYMSP